MPRKKCKKTKGSNQSPAAPDTTEKPASKVARSAGHGKGGQDQPLGKGEREDGQDEVGLEYPTRLMSLALILGLLEEVDGEDYRALKRHLEKNITDEERNIIEGLTKEDFEEIMAAKRLLPKKPLDKWIWTINPLSLLDSHFRNLGGGLPSHYENPEEDILGAISLLNIADLQKIGRDEAEQELDKYGLALPVERAICILEYINRESPYESVRKAAAEKIAGLQAEAGKRN